MSDLRTRRTADSYSARAEQFDREWAPVLRPLAERLLPLLGLGAARVVLDLGTGTGGLLGSLAAAAPRARIFGLDPAEGMVAVAARKVVGADFVIADSQALPLAAACADAALFSFVLHRVLDPAAALVEAARAVRPGGRIGSVTWAWRSVSPSGRSGRIENHRRVDTPTKMADLMAAAGLRVRASWVDEVVYAVGEVPR